MSPTRTYNTQNKDLREHSFKDYDDNDVDDDDDDDDDDDTQFLLPVMLIIRELRVCRIISCIFIIKTRENFLTVLGRRV